MNRLVSALALVLVLASIATPVAAAAAPAIQENETATPNATTTQPRETTASTEERSQLSELRQGGNVIFPETPSVRALEDEPTSVHIRKHPPGPTAPEWDYLGLNDKVETNSLTFVARRIGEGDPKRQVTINIVYWVPETRTVEGPNGSTTTERYAKVLNRDTQSVTLAAGRGQTRAEIKLRPHFQREVRITMWLETADGERIEGARWSNIRHQSLPTEQGVDVDSAGDLVLWGFKFAGIIGIVAFPGLKLTDKALNRAGAPPMVGLGGWLLLGGIAIVGAILFAWTQTATFFARAPEMIAVGIGLALIVAMTEVGGKEPEKVLFERDLITEATSPSGDEVKDTLRTATVEKHAIDEDDGLKLVSTGPMAFLARAWTGKKGATVPTGDLTTRVETIRGEWREKYIADPIESPAGGFDELDTDEYSPLIHREEGWGMEMPFSGEDWKEQAKHGLGWLATMGLFGSVGYLLGSEWLLYGPFAATFVGTVAAGFAAIVYLATPRTASVEFEPSTVHYTQALATTHHRAAEWVEGRTLDDFEQIAIEAKTDAKLEARQHAARRDRTVTQKMNDDELGWDDLDVDETELDSETDDSEAEDTEGAIVPVDDD